MLKRIPRATGTHLILLCLSRSIFGQLPQPPASVAAPATAPTQTPSEMLKEARQFYRVGKFTEATDKFQAVLHIDPRSEQAYAGLTRTYLEQEKIQFAWDTIHQGLAALPDSMAIHTALGEVYFRQGKMTEAEREFVKAVNSHQREARAYLGLARVYSSISLHARARAMMNNAHELDADDPDIARRWMGTLTRPERIKYLENYLGHPGNDDPKTWEDLQQYLKVLKAREQQPRKPCKLARPLSGTQAGMQPLLSDATHIRGYGLNVKINGQSSRLLLDTGASGILINRRMAEKAQLQRISSSAIGGIGDKGTTNSYSGYADSIQIGELEFQNCVVEVLDKRSVMDEDGLIGADVFSNYLVTIDFPESKLRLDPLPKRPNAKDEPVSLTADEEDSQPSEVDTEKDKDPESRGKGESAPATKTQAATIAGPQDRYIAPEMASYTKVYRFGHDLLIPTGINETPPKLFLIDTGAFNNLISPDAAREVTKVHHDNEVKVTGLSGAVDKVYRADQATIRFSHFKQDNMDLVALDLSNISRHDGTEVSGILGFNMLRMLVIKIDYRDGLVDFAFDPDRWPH